MIKITIQQIKCYFNNNFDRQSKIYPTENIRTRVADPRIYLEKWEKNNKNWENGNVGG